MDACRLDKKLVCVKKFNDSSLVTENICKTGLEAGNKGCFALFTDGRLALITWINKKISTKIIEDVSDASWQSRESDILITYKNGGLLRYSIHYDTGLSCSLQLSAPTLLSMLRVKDPRIRSIKYLQILGHTQEHILLEPQCDRLALLASNCGGLPTVSFIIRTPPIRTAHLGPKWLILQPLAGNDLHLYDVSTMKIKEVIVLDNARSFTEWGGLVTSPLQDVLALCDAERHIYVAYTKKKTKVRGSGTKTLLAVSKLIWPTAITHTEIQDIQLSLSESTLSTFFSYYDKDKGAERFYISFDTNMKSVICLHRFVQDVVLIPGGSFECPDLFLTSDSVSMLMDEDASISSLDSETDLSELVSSLEEALEEQSVIKVTEIKAIVEHSFNLFLSSCNHQEDWVSLAHVHAEKYQQLADLILKQITLCAQESGEVKQFGMSLLQLATHHFQSLHVEMENVLQYIDAEDISQMVLQLKEQVSFYNMSVNHLKSQWSEEEGVHSECSLEQNKNWEGKTLKEVIEDGLMSKCVPSAEEFLKRRPWIYGSISSSMVLDTCVDVSRHEILVDGSAVDDVPFTQLDHSYTGALKERLYMCDDQFEVNLLHYTLKSWNALTPNEDLAAVLVLWVHKSLPDNITLPPKLWTDLVKLGDASIDKVFGPLNVAQVSRWSSLAIMLVLADLYSFTGDENILEAVDPDVLWQYLLHQNEINKLKQWIYHEFGSLDELSDNDSALVKGSGQDSKEIENLEFKFVVEKSPEEEEEEIYETKKKNSSRLAFANLLKEGTLYGSEGPSSVDDSSQFDCQSVASDMDTRSLCSLVSLPIYTRMELWPKNHFPKITQMMVDLVNIAEEQTVDTILNILANFGVFTTIEKSDVSALMCRLISSSAIMKVNIFEVRHECQISREEIHMGFLKHLQENELTGFTFDYIENLVPDDLELRADSDKYSQVLEWVKLLRYFQQLGKNQSQGVIYNLSLLNLSFITLDKKGRDYVSTAAFLTMLFAPSATLKEFHSHTSDPCNCEKVKSLSDVASLCKILKGQGLSPHNVVEHVALQFPYLAKSLCSEEWNEVLDVSLYDLLLGNIPFDVGRLFTWQNSNRYGYDTDAELPHFSDGELMRNMGLQWTLDYIYYLRSHRPSYACATMLTALQMGNEKRKCAEIQASVQGLALSLWPEKMCCSAAVASLLMIGADAELLRVTLAVAFKVLQLIGEQCTEPKKEKRQTLEKSHTLGIKTLLQDMCQEDKRLCAAQSLLDMLEDYVIKGVEICCKGKPSSAVRQSGLPSFSNSNSISAKTCNGNDGEKKNMTSPEVFFKLIEGVKMGSEFAEKHKLPYPLNIFIYLAQENEWLPFLILAQAFNCPRVALTVAANSFKAHRLKEHMLYALNHTYYYVSDATKQRTVSQTTRSSLYMRIGIQGKPASVNSDEISGSPDDSESTVIDDAATCSTSDTSDDSINLKWRSHGSLDVYSVLLECSQESDPTTALLEAALHHRVPIFAVFATCYSGFELEQCFGVWLYSHLECSSKENHSDIEAKLFTTDGDHKPKTTSYFKVKELEELVCYFMEADYLDILIEGFEIFCPTSPLFSLLKAVYHVKLSKCLTTSEDNLKECAEITRKLTSMNPVQTQLLDLDWSQKMTIIVIGKALDSYLNNRHFQLKFLSQLKQVGKCLPFQSYNIDWELLHSVCGKLADVNVKVNFSSILWSFENEKINEEVLSIVSEVSSLQCYAEAQEIALLARLPIHAILCARLRSEFEEKLHTSNTEVVHMFLSHCNLTFKKQNCPPNFVKDFFVSQIDKILCPSLRYECLHYALMWLYNWNDEASSTEKEDEDDIKLKKDAVHSLETQMWKNLIQSRLDKSEAYFHEKVHPLDDFSYWPWEDQETGISPLHFSKILEASECKFEDVVDIEERQKRVIDDVDQKFDHSRASHSPQDKDNTSNNRENNEETRTKQKPQVMFKENIVDQDFTNDIIHKLVSECLNEGYIITACRILKHFDVFHAGTRLLLTMLGLVEESLSKKKVWSEFVHPGSSDDPECNDFNISFKNGEVKSAAPEVFREVRRTNSGLLRMRSCTSSYSYMSLDSEDMEGGSLMSLLVQLSSELTCGRKTADRILALYRVATMLNMNYVALLHHKQPLMMLKKVLKMKGPNTTTVAKNLIDSLPISSGTVVEFLCEEAIASITAGPGSPRHPDHLLRWEELEEKWKDLLILCKDPTHLGNRLLNVGQNIGSSHPDQVSKVHSMSVEVVIRAHDCFSAAANMEGISQVLRTALTLTTSLIQHKQWILMVRLLLGIGRFSEMGYIIDTLRENNQFERVLSRRVECRKGDLGLDHTLIHYLRTKFPEDKEMLRLVALHFLLYSEAAAMWVDDAEKAIDKVLEVSTEIPHIKDSTTSYPKRNSNSHNLSSEAFGSSLSGRSTPLTGSYDVTDSHTKSTDVEFLQNADPSLLKSAMDNFSHAAQYYMQDNKLVKALNYSRQGQLVALQLSHVNHRNVPPNASPAATITSRGTKQKKALRLLRLSDEVVKTLATKYLRVGEAILLGQVYDVDIDWASVLYYHYFVNNDQSFLKDYISLFDLSSDVVLAIVKRMEADLRFDRSSMQCLSNLLGHLNDIETKYQVASQYSLRGVVESCLSSSAAPYLKDTIFQTGFSTNI